MSTKIYTGFQINGDSWHYLLFQINVFRDSAKKVIEQRSAQKLIEQACQIWDQSTLGISPIKGNSSAWHEAWLDSLGEHGLPKFTIVLFSRSSRTYGMTFGDQEIENLWFAQEFVERFPYWNNSDRPRGISQKDWDCRGALWDEIVGNHPPSMRGACVEVIPPYRCDIGIDEAMKYMPPLEARAKKAVTDQVYDEFKEARAGKNESGLKSLYAFLGWMQSDAGQDAVNKAKVEAMRVLPETITREMLLANPVERN